MGAMGANNRIISQTAEMHKQAEPKFIETFMLSQESLTRELTALLKRIPLQISSIKVKHVAAQIIFVQKLLKWARNNDLFHTVGHLQ